PVLIAMLVPLRMWMGKRFDPEHLDALDHEQDEREIEEDTSSVNLHP
ncbi:MAG: hypothetical protein ACI80K_001852, partial [Paracoccaceae bacterium]